MRAAMVHGVLEKNVKIETLPKGHNRAHGNGRKHEGEKNMGTRSARVREGGEKKET